MSNKSYAVVVVAITIIMATCGALNAGAQECYDNGPNIREHFDECEWLNDWMADCGPSPGTNEWRSFAYLQNDGPSADGSVNNWSLYQQTCLLDLSVCNARQPWRTATCVCDTCAECYYP